MTKPKSLEIMDQLFEIAVQRNASDIHIVVGKPPLLRVAGEIAPIEGVDVVTSETAQDLLFSITTDDEKERFIRDKELDMAHQVPSGKRFRINLHWEKQHVAMAARTIPSEVPSMKSLELPAVADYFVGLPHGLVLVTGPTGSGKSTTLAAMVNTINATRAANIITLEDPIEFLFEPK
ncbi:MAG: ATPase, T2SS/T4P/T4SS family, partial [Patescibacteria group bacterium]